MELWASGDEIEDDISQKVLGDRSHFFQIAEERQEIVREADV